MRFTWCQLLTYLYIYYRPERWFKDIPGGNVVPGVWGNVLTFIGGARSCIGFRFALVEYVPHTDLRPLKCSLSDVDRTFRMKAILFQLIRSLEFELDAQVGDVGRKSVYVSHNSAPYRCAALLTGIFCLASSPGHTSSLRRKRVISSL